MYSNHYNSTSRHRFPQPVDRRALKYLIRDRDAIFGGEFVAITKSMGIEEVVTAPRSPWSAVINGVLAPPLIVLVVLLTCDRKVMGDRVSPSLLRALGWLTAAVMAFAAVAMFATMRE